MNIKGSMLSLIILLSINVYASPVKTINSKSEAQDQFKNVMKEYNSCVISKSFSNIGVDNNASYVCDTSGIQSLTRFIKNIRVSKRTTDEVIWNEINERHQFKVSQCETNVKEVYFRNSERISKSCEFSGYVSLAQAAINLHF